MKKDSWKTKEGEGEEVFYHPITVLVHVGETGCQEGAQYLFFLVI